MRYKLPNILFQKDLKENNILKQIDKKAAFQAAFFILWGHKGQLF